jgi:radical SAM superfamily enzyme YgiQ (UPF0313 family)
VKIVLISTYELGRQPFGLASPAAWLRSQGVEVECFDLSRQSLEEAAVRAADVVAFYVPMHTATRLAVALLHRIREINPSAHLCFYGLYASVNETYLRSLGVETILGGEFEERLVSLVTRLADGGASRIGQFVNGAVAGNSRVSDQTTPIAEKVATDVASYQAEPVISLARQKFQTPDRSGMMSLEKYARLTMPDGHTRTVGYTEASRGCKHLCRHCPIVPVYGGVFRVVDRDVVLADIRQQVTAGAQHITFGDPDFFNGTGHAIPIVEALHREFPQLTYDVTIKIEHLLKHRNLLPMLRDTGCLFVTSAVESADDAVLEKLEKHHTRADFLRAVGLCREIGLTLQPTFVPFSPWTTLENYRELLTLLRENDLVGNVAPIQLAIRLLIPAGSRLLELDDVRELTGKFDEAALVYRWKHVDARVDELCERLQKIVNAAEKMNLPRAQIFERIEDATYAAAGLACEKRPASKELTILHANPPIPYLNEPWYCCAEPTSDQLAAMTGTTRARADEADAFV